MRTLFAILVLTAAANAQTLPEPDARFMVDLTPKPAKPALTRLPSGYLWTFADAQAYKESFAQYRQRTGKLPPEARSQCSTGYCGTFSGSPTIATGGCTCGCVASLCGCHHSPNAGKPLAAQLYQPGRVSRYRR